VGNFFEGIFKPRRDKDGNVIQVAAPTPSASTSTGAANANANANEGKSATSTNKTMETPPLSPCPTTPSGKEETKEDLGLRRRSSLASLAMFGSSSKS
jgi:hypothetical protein